MEMKAGTNNIVKAQFACLFLEHGQELFLGGFFVGG
jgi:hypothetical protein